MTIYAILAAIAAVLGAFLGLRRKASRERDARVMAETQRDVARGKAEVAEATVAVVAEVEARKDAAVEVGEDYRAEVAALATAAHAAAVAATPPAGVRVVSNEPPGAHVTVGKSPVSNEPTPAEVIAAADEARRNARTRAKIAAGRKGRL